MNENTAIATIIVTVVAGLTIYHVMELLVQAGVFTK